MLRALAVPYALSPLYHVFQECVDDSPPSLALPVAAMCTDSLLSNAVMESAIMQAFEVE